MALVDGKYLLQKFAGKGGWTYVEISEINPDKQNPFGWVKVRGSIDIFELKHYKLMPMGKGKLFLPVKAEIRKKIQKEAGQWVHIILYYDTLPLEIPNDLKVCFDYEDPELLKTFKSFTEEEQKVYLDWIYSAKKEETKANRINSMMIRLNDGLRFYDK